MLRQNRVVEYIKRFERLFNTSRTAGGHERVEALLGWLYFADR